MSLRDGKKDTKVRRDEYEREVGHLIGKV